MTRDAVNDPRAAAVGPYSHGVWAGELLYLSGQTPIDAATRALVEGDAGTQTRQCLANLAAVLAQAGLGLGDVVKCNVYLVDMADFAAMNAAYREAFAAPFPARTTVGVAALPLGARVEIELVARRPARG
jgi:2-iminobutanoate/2-iminopropanoate deaminase